MATLRKVWQAVTITNQSVAPCFSVIKSGQSIGQVIVSFSQKGRKVRVLIEGVEVEMESVTFNDGLNYGRFDSRNIDIYSYEFSLTKSEFISLMSASFQKCMVEIKADDEVYNDSSPFKEMGYVAIEDAFDYPEHLGEAMSTYFDRELYGKVLGSAKSSSFIVNSTEKVEINDERINIIGRCFRYK